MAESQEIFDYDHEALEALNVGLSPARFAEYLAESHGDAARAIRLYLWNARLAKAFLFPLQICEVFTRNAIDTAFSARWGRGWVLAPPFPLNDFSQDSHQRTVGRLQRTAERNRLAPPSADDVVAALTFDFWSNLFRQDYDVHLWNDGSLLSGAFPNLPGGQGRRDVQLLMASVNTLRNRIAHHEPIHNRQDHGAKLNEILTLIGHSSRAAREWTRQHSTVMTVAKSPPSAYSTVPGRPLSQSNLRPPPIFASTAKLSDALPELAAARPAVALVEAPNSACGYAAVTSQTLTAFVAPRLADSGGLIDYTEYTLSEVAEAGSVAIGLIDHRATTGDAMMRFYPGKGRDRIDLLVVQSHGKVIGLLQRPDARF